jgi:hypothetical protein
LVEEAPISLVFNEQFSITLMATPLQAEALSAQPTASTEAAPAADDAFLARCRAAAEYSRTHDGEVLLVLLDGKPVFDIQRRINSDHPSLRDMSGGDSGLAESEGAHDPRSRPSTAKRRLVHPEWLAGAWGKCRDRRLQE